MAKTLQINFADRIGDALFMALLRAGITMGTMSLLTVRGRKSGQPHTVPVLLVEQDGQRWLVAPYGVVQWVRNLRAAGTATLTRSRRSEAISVTELEAQRGRSSTQTVSLAGPRGSTLLRCHERSPL